MNLSTTKKVIVISEDSKINAIMVMGTTFGQVKENIRNTKDNMQMVKRMVKELFGLKAANNLQASLKMVITCMEK